MSVDRLFHPKRALGAQGPISSDHDLLESSYTQSPVTREDDEDPRGRASLSAEAEAQADRVLTHKHWGHPQEHPISLRHRKQSADPLHGEEDKLVDEYKELWEKATRGDCSSNDMIRMRDVKGRLDEIQSSRETDARRIIGNQLDNALEGFDQWLGKGRREPGYQAGHFETDDGLTDPIFGRTPRKRMVPSSKRSLKELAHTPQMEPRGAQDRWGDDFYDDQSDGGSSILEEQALSTNVDPKSVFNENLEGDQMKITLGQPREYKSIDGDMYVDDVPMLGRVGSGDEGMSDLLPHEYELLTEDLDGLETEHQDAIFNIMRMLDRGKLTEADEEELLDRCDGKGSDLRSALASSSEACVLDLEQLVLGPGYTARRSVVQRGEIGQQLSTVNKHQGSAFTQRPVS